MIFQDFSRRVSAKSSALFYGNAFIVSSIPIWLYWRIHAIDPTATAIVLAIVTIVSTWLVAFAYRNTKHVLKHKVAVKREAAVTKDMNKEVSLYYYDYWNAYQTIKPVAKGKMTTRQHSNAILPVITAQSNLVARFSLASSR